MIRGLVAVGLVAAMAATAPVAKAEQTRKILTFQDLDGWRADDHRAALDVFLSTCGDLRGAEWAALCALAATHPKPRAFFELFFRPVLIEDGSPALFTGYFEPELAGSRKRSARFRFPLYRKPPELRSGELWFTREEIEGGGILDGRGLEIAWVDDPVELFYLQVQGSGRIDLDDGTTIRVGYGGTNGHPYKSPGKELVRRGVYTPHQVSAQVIGNWVRRNPIKGMALLRSNPGYVFFRELPGLGSESGPLGAMNRPLTPLRSLAVDRRFVPLGAPVWVEKGGADAFRRLMVAQDTGSAIKGAQRGDLFMGTGDAAGRAAARISDPGRMVVLLPIELAYASASEAGQ